MSTLSRSPKAACTPILIRCVAIGVDCPVRRVGSAPATLKYLSATYLIKIGRSEEHTSELQSRFDLVCRLLLEKKKKKNILTSIPKENRNKILKLQSYLYTYVNLLKTHSIITIPTSYTIPIIYYVCKFIHFFSI